MASYIKEYACYFDSLNEILNRAVGLEALDYLLEVPVVDYFGNVWVQY